MGGAIWQPTPAIQKAMLINIIDRIDAQDNNIEITFKQEITLAPDTDSSNDTSSGLSQNGQIDQFDPNSPHFLPIIV